MKDKANGLSKSGQDGLPSNVVCKRMARREWREDTSRPVPSPMGEHVHDHGVGSGLPTGWLAQQMLACSPTPRSSVPSYKQLCVHIRTKLMIMTPAPALRKLLNSTQSGCPPPAEGGQKKINLTTKLLELSFATSNPFLNVPKAENVKYGLENMNVCVNCVLSPWILFVFEQVVASDLFSFLSSSLNATSPRTIFILFGNFA